MSDSLRELVDSRPMSRFQKTAVATCVLLNVIDGFDVLVMSFTGRAVSAEFGLSGAQLGLLLSAGLVGMAVGSVFVAPWADRVGRRPVVLASLTLAAVSMSASAAAQSALQLGALRVVTGIGVGGILAASNVIAAEYASRRWRGLAVSLNSTGYAVGAVLGGLLAGALVGGVGWRAVFLVGGLVTAAVIPLVWWRLPESLDFLLTRQPAGARERVDDLAVRMGHAPPGELPVRPDDAGLGSRYRELVAPALRRATLVLWIGFFCVMASYYFVLSWTPTLLTEAGLSPDAGIAGGTLLNLGGIVGAAALGLLTARFAMRHVLAGFLVATAVLMALFIASTSSLALAFTTAAVIGVFANGSIAGLYALSPVIYGPGIRTTGVGTAMAIGRTGAILAPTIAGALLDGGWTPQALYIAFGVVFAVAGASMLLLPREIGRTGTDARTPAAMS